MKVSALHLTSLLSAPLTAPSPSRPRARVVELSDAIEGISRRASQMAEAGLS